MNYNNLLQQQIFAESDTEKDIEEKRNLSMPIKGSGAMKENRDSNVKENQ